MELAALLLFALLAWILMGRTLVAAATLATFLPFIALTSFGAGSGEAVETLGGMAGIKGIMRFGGASLFVYLLGTSKGTLRDLFQGPSLLALGFFVWGLLGILGSAHPLVSLIRLSEWFVFFLGAVVINDRIARTGGAVALLRFCLLGVSPLIMLLFYTLVVHPEKAFETRAMDGLSRLGGLSMDPNSIGVLGAVLAIGAATYWRLCWEHRTRRKNLLATVLMVVGIYLLMITRSRTALLAFTAGSMFLLWGAANKNKVVHARLLLGCLLFICALVYFREQLFLWTLRGDDVEVLLSGTGRSDLWVGLVTEAFPSRPILGHGYMMLGPTGPYLAHGTPWSNAHNAFLFALVSTGIVGFGLTVWMASLAARSLLIRRVVRRSDKLEWIGRQGLGAIFVVILVDSLADYGMVGHPTAAMFLYQILFVYSYFGGRKRESST